MVKESLDSQTPKASTQCRRSKRRSWSLLWRALPGVLFWTFAWLCCYTVPDCAALHSIQFPRFCKWLPLSLHRLVFWSFQTITAFMFVGEVWKQHFRFIIEFPQWVWLRIIRVQWLHMAAPIFGSSRVFSKHHAWHCEVRHLSKPRPWQDVQLWWLNYCFCEGVGIGAVGNPFFGGEAVNICLPLQVRDDWHWRPMRPLLLQPPCLLMPHWSVLLASSTWIPNLRLLQQKACWWWQMERLAAVWLVY